MSARLVARFVDQAERNSGSAIAERLGYSVPRTSPRTTRNIFRKERKEGLEYFNRLNECKCRAVDPLRFETFD